MKVPLGKRRLAALVALGAAVATTLLVVVPALATATSSASTAYSQVPPPASPSGITPIDEPTGGQSNDCSYFYTNTNNHVTKPQPAYQFRIANPKKGTFDYTDPQTGAKFTVAVDSTDKWASFTTNNAKVVDVGIKGGTDETWYNYDQASTLFPNTPVNDLGGYVSHDGDGGATLSSGGLHAPVSTSGALLSVSNTTFCYNVGSVSGRVYDDVNQNGSYDAGTVPPDQPQQGWKVTLYKGSSTTAVGTATSGADGTYRIPAIFDLTGTYTVCETPSATDAASTWAQSEPRPASATICKQITGALPNGGVLSPSKPLDDVTQNFGNVPAVTCTQPMNGTDYSVLMPGSAGCEKRNTFAFNSGIDPINGPFVSLLAGDSTLANVPVAEKVTFADPFSGGQPQYTGLAYTDKFPAGTPSAMPYCKVDPRDPTNTTDYPGAAPTDLRLAHTYITLAESGAVLPDPATSCVIALTITAPTAASPGTGTLVAYVYSLADSQYWAD